MIVTHCSDDLFYVPNFFRNLAVRLPLEKAMDIQEATRNILEKLDHTSRKEWEKLFGLLNFAAQLSEEAKFRKKVTIYVLCSC